MNHNIQNKIKKWHDYLSLRNMSPHTQDAYHHDVMNFLNFLHTHYNDTVSLDHLNTLTLQDARSWMAHRHAPLSARSNARAVAAVRHFWRFLQQHDFIQNDAFLLLKSPKRPISLPRPLSIDQTHELLDHIKNVSDIPWVSARDYALVMLLYGTGMRISEALSLTQKDRTQPTLTIMGKGRRTRHIPLMMTVQRALCDYIDQCPFQGESAPLFYSVRGKPLSRFSAAKILRDYRASYDAPASLTPHALRHTCATHLMNNSKDLRGIQTLLGHASLSSTQIYTDLDMDTLLESYHAAHPRTHVLKNDTS